MISAGLSNAATVVDEESGVGEASRVDEGSCAAADSGTVCALTSVPISGAAAIKSTRSGNVAGGWSDDLSGGVAAATERDRA